MEDFLGLLFFLFFFFVLPALQKRKADQRKRNERPAADEMLTEPATRTPTRPPTARPRPTAAESRTGTETRRGVPEKETPFQEALRQIREALEEAQQQQTPEPEPPPRAPTRVPAAVSRPDPHPSPLPAPPPIRLDRRTGFEHERHGFGRENPLSEEAFERRPAFSVAPRTRKPDFDPHGLRPEPARSAPTRTTPRTLLDKLRRPQTARDALVLAEVLGPPKGRSRRR